MNILCLLGFLALFALLVIVIFFWLHEIIIKKHTSFNTLWTIALLTVGCAYLLDKVLYYFF